MTGAGSSSDTDLMWISAIDLLVCFTLTLLFILIQLLVDAGNQPVVVLFYLLFLLSVPGYAFVSAVFPKRATTVRGDPYNSDIASTNSSENLSSDWVFGNDRSDTAPASSDESRMGLSERAVLSLGFSLPIVVLDGIIINISRWEISPASVVTVVAATTILSLGVAALRRWRTATAKRFGIGTGRPHLIRWARMARSDNTIDTVFNVLIVAGVAFTLLFFTFGLVTSHSGEQFTEFYVLEENGSGNLVAGSYPTEYEYGEPQQVHLGIGNREDKDERYHVAIILQQFTTKNGSKEVVNEHFLKNISVNVARDDRRIVETQVTPQLSGTNLRLEFLLYRGSLPREPSEDTAYREIHYWVDVSKSNKNKAM